jgi:hypothetical protein
MYAVGDAERRGAGRRNHRGEIAGVDDVAPAAHLITLPG